MRRPSGNNHVGLEIHDDEVRLAVATPVEKGYAVHCLRGQLPAGAVDQGRAADSDAVVATLRGMLGTLPVRPRQASLVLGGRHTVCRVEAYRGAQNPDAVAACQDRMHRYLVFGGQPTFTACAPQGASSDPDATGWLLGAASLRQLVQHQIELARRAGLTVVRAEPAMLAVACSLLGADSHTLPRFVLVAHSEGCEIAVVREDKVTFCQQFGVGARSLARNCDQLVAMLEQVLDYHLRHGGGQEHIEELLCCGPPQEFEESFGRLSEAGVRASWADPLQLPRVQRLDGDGVATPAERSTITPAVVAALAGGDGAGLRCGPDLLPARESKRRLRPLSASIVVPILVTLVVTLGLMTWETVSGHEAGRLTHLLNNPTPEMRESAGLQLRTGQLGERRADIELLMASTPRYAAKEFVTELPRRLPKEVWLERLGLDGSGKCWIDGLALTEDVFGFADALRSSPYVESVRMSRTGQERMGGLLVTRFRIEVALATLGGSPSGGSKNE